MNLRTQLVNCVGVVVHDGAEQGRIDLARKHVCGSGCPLHPSSETTLMYFRLLSIILFASAFSLPGCGQPEEPLRVGANVWPGYEPMFLARSLGYYRDYPVKLIVFSSTAEVIRAYQNGLIDVAAVTADEALIVAESQPGDHRIVLVCDSSRGADVLMAKPEFESIRQLKGRRVGVENTALGAYMLARALEWGGLAAEDVTTVAVALPKHVSAFTSGQIDAVITFEPNRSRVLAAGARQLFDSSQIPGEIVDLILTRRNLTDSQNRALAAFVAGWFRALAYLQANPHDAAARVAVREAVTPQQFLDSLQGLELTDLPQNLRLLGNSPGNLGNTLGKLSEVMLKNKILSRATESPLLDDSFIRTANL